MLSVKLLFCLLAYCCLYGSGKSAQCEPDEVNPCVARCNYTAFDLSKAFDFPINITERNVRTDGRLYWYMWSPCESYHCPGYNKEIEDCAVCQKADALYCCGRTSRPIFKWDTFINVPGMPKSTDDSSTFPSYTIEYTFGTTWRMAVFHFVIDDQIEEPIVEFVSEKPFLQYNFIVTGKCIGQHSSECTKFYSEKRERRIKTLNLHLVE